MDIVPTRPSRETGELVPVAALGRELYFDVATNEVSRQPPPDRGASLADGPAMPAFEEVGAGLQLEMVHGCNLKCVYCAVNQGKFRDADAIPVADKILDLARIEAMVDELFRTLWPFPRFTTLFYGGEPLLVPDRVEAAASMIRERCRQAGVPAVFKVTTNGTVATPMVLEMLDRFAMRVQISVDGPPEIHDTRRPFVSGRGSFERIHRNLTALARYPNIRAHLLAVYAPTDGPLVSFVDRLEAHFPGLPIVVRLETPQCSTGAEDRRGRLVGIGRQAATHGTDGRDPGFEPALIGELTAVAEAIGRRLSRRPRFASVANLLNVFGADLHALFHGQRRRRACGVGRKQVSLGPSGAVYPCHTYTMLRHRRIGTIEGRGVPGLDHEALARLETDLDVDRRQPCSTCWARYLCGGYCAVVSEDRTGGVSRAWTGHCDAIRGRAALAIALFDLLRADYPHVLIEMFQAEDLRRALAAGA